MLRVETCHLLSIFLSDLEGRPIPSLSSVRVRVTRSNRSPAVFLKINGHLLCSFLGPLSLRILFFLLQQLVLWRSETFDGFSGDNSSTATCIADSPSNAFIDGEHIVGQQPTSRAQVGVIAVTVQLCRQTRRDSSCQPVVASTDQVARDLIQYHSLRSGYINVHEELVDLGCIEPREVGLIFLESFHLSTVLGQNSG